MPEKANIKKKAPKGRYSKPRRSKLKMRNQCKRQVLKMLAVMESQQASTSRNAPSGQSAAITTPEGKVEEQEFLATGRTGRRNALPDILSDHAIVTSSDLPGKFQKLSTTDNNGNDNKKDQAGPSSACL